MNIDTTNLPPCADIPDPKNFGDITDLKEFGEALAKSWDEKNITNIRFIVQSLISRAELNCLRYGQNILLCRAEIVARNKEIDRLKGEQTMKDNRSNAAKQEAAEACDKCGEHVLNGEGHYVGDDRLCSRCASFGQSKEEGITNASTKETTKETSQHRP